ncbi:MAG: tRNA pseudouridine(55) synthase TruB [Candidatus Cloacimonadaceae bacterium]|jgi:tRNA pseudouridine55 synthase|nr:tRNA pseudouridine(55) synthase TruB [Candidatus Cloacimonadota bacterium]MDD5624566.1 tRNA pseudouridine(55) synthase TruB [Candidatus Cloacimonadota bacterium]MDY0111644.1 tRNA pseudouridine(55) synthase TruB [Candidatus Syntrophosphaera sp.]
MSDNQGFLLIDKALGISSFALVRQLRDITGISRIGHTGTLDPLASGLLIFALGSYTRLCQFLEAQDKEYEAVLKLGEQTETGDIEGKVIATSENIPSRIDKEDLRKNILQITSLRTPAYSAVKVKGKPAYSYARNGIKVELEDRPVNISEFEVIDYSPPYLIFRCKVSKGTYIRSLGELIAQLLGTAGFCISLRRTSIGHLKVSQAAKIEDITKENFSYHFFPVKELFPDFEQLILPFQELLYIKNGNPIPNSGIDNEKILIFDSDGSLQGVAKRKDGILIPYINLKN